MNMKINKQKALQLAKDFNINLNIVPFDEWQEGLNIELEHGKQVSKLTNLTNDNLQITAKIAIAPSPPVAVINVPNSKMARPNPSIDAPTPSAQPIPG